MLPTRHPVPSAALAYICIVIPAKAGIRPSQMFEFKNNSGRMPAYAGMTSRGRRLCSKFSLNTLAVSIIVSLTSAGIAHAAVKGTFVGPGTYATEEGCKKLAALAAGGDKNVGTVPETLTEDGFETWEGACTFTSFTEKDKGRSWTARMACAEEALEGSEQDLFERMDDGKIKVTVMETATLLQRCDAK
jgi:hypothetical protein